MRSRPRGILSRPPPLARAAEENILTIDDAGSLAPPTAIGPYRVLHQVGAGVLGPVFRAHSADENREVAVKLFKLDLTPEQARELASGLSRLCERIPTHPHIPACFGAGLAGSTPWLAQEYVPADALDARLRRRTGGGLKHSLPVLRQIAAAIDAAADRGLHHGALHPRDVLISTTGEVRVTGFGVADAVVAAGGPAVARRPYAAPERSGTTLRPADAAADVFSLGTIAVEMLTGRRPIGTGATAVGFVSGVAEGIDADACRRALARALADAPRERFATATAFVAALARAAESAGDEAAPVATPARVAAHAPAAAVKPPAPTIEPPVAPIEPPVAPIEAPLAPPATPVVTAAKTPQTPSARERPASPAPNRSAPASQAAKPRERPQRDSPPVVLPSPVATPPERPGPEPTPVAPAAPIATPESTPASIQIDTPDVAHSVIDVPSSSLEVDFPISEGPGAPARLAASPAPPPASAPRIDALPPAEPVGPIELRSAPPATGPEVQRTPRLWLHVAVLAIGVGVGLLAGYLLWGRTARPLSQAAAPPAAAAVTATTDRSQPAAPPTGSSARPSVAPAQAPVAPSEADRSTSPPKVAAPAPAPKPPPAAARGRVFVRSRPAGARVTIDGRSRGETPMTIDDLPLGAHEVTLSRQGYQSVTRRVTLKTSRTVNVTVSLQRRPAEPASRSEAGAKGQPSPSKAAPAATTNATLEVVSRPTGARVFIDGTLAGTTPLTTTSVAPGTHAVRLELPGHRPWTTSVTLERGRRARVAGSLELVP